MRRLLIAGLLLLGMPLFAQQDTLKYDGVDHIYDGYLIAGTMFPGELDMFYNARFTPLERCTVNGVQIALSVVKFVAHSGFDTLVVQVFENSAVPPTLTNIVKTYTYPLGDMGFPSPNVADADPLQQGLRDILTVPFSPPDTIAPKRDFLIGVKLRTRQSVMVDTTVKALWNGLSLLMKLDCPEFDRFRRYHINDDPMYTGNPPATDTRKVGIYMRALVTYNAQLPDTKPVSTGDLPVATTASLDQNFPNPFHGRTDIRFTLAQTTQVRLSVHDVLGRTVAVVAEGMMAPGVHTAVFDAAMRALPAGFYLLRLSAGDVVQTRSMLMLQ